MPSVTVAEYPEQVTPIILVAMVTVLTGPHWTGRESGGSCGANARCGQGHKVTQTRLPTT